MTDQILITQPTVPAEAPAVSWGAIFAGALAAAVLSLVLLLVGAGIGLTTLSPWAGAGVGLATFSVGAAAWLVVMQWASAGIGGYVAGRLRANWDGVHPDETFFRDTAHGFLAWALATLVTVVLLSSAVMNVVGAGIGGTASLVQGATQGAAQGAVTRGVDLGPLSPDYFVDSLFRPQAGGNAAATGGADDDRSQASRILLASLVTGTMSEPDKAELARLIATRTGLSGEDAAKRLTEVQAQIGTAMTTAKETADKARKVSATMALLTALSLMVGAFIAGVAAALGGRVREAP